MPSPTQTERMQDIVALADRLHLNMQEELRRSVRCCIHCDHFDEEREICKGVDKRPPARVIAFGCEYFLDIIPF